MLKAAVLHYPQPQRVEANKSQNIDLLIGVLGPSKVTAFVEYRLPAFVIVLSYK